MRDIKFRSFVEHTDSTGGPNNYSYMNYELDFHGSVNEIFEQSGIKPLNPLHNKITYMQYTGLKDKNGKEIYEGDIVKVEIPVVSVNEDFIGEVKMFEGRWWVDNGHDAIPLWSEVNEIAVLGNIYENPELLGDSN